MEEQWRDVIGYEGLYKISDLGRIMCLVGTKVYPSGTILKPQVKIVGYPRLTLSKRLGGKQIIVHIAVMRAFVGEPQEGMEIDHIDGDRNNAALSNLEYVTHQENIIRWWKRQRSVTIGN